MVEEKVKLILIVSEQIIPNLTSVLHYWKKGDLDAVHLLYTNDELRSKAPARRLAKLLEEIRKIEPYKDCGDITIELDRIPVRIEPQHVRARVNELLNSDPEARWVLNATGGLKLMAFGPPDLLAPPGTNHRFTMIYQERVAGWFDLVRNADGKIDASSAARQPDQALLDDIPVEVLARTQYMGNEALKLLRSDNESKLNILDFVQKANEAKWEWGSFSMQAAGTEFEHLILAAIPKMGVKNFAYSVKTVHTARSAGMHEADFVLCHKGRVFVLELKLKNEPDDAARGKQIREAADAARNFGGLDAQAILIRPSWLPDEAITDLAIAHRVKLLDQSKMGRLFSEIAGLIGGTPDEDLKKADDSLKAFKDANGYAITGTRVQEMSAKEKLKPNSIIALDDFILKERLEMTQQNWALLQLGACTILAVKKPEADKEIFRSSISMPPEPQAVFKKAGQHTSPNTAVFLWTGLMTDDLNQIKFWMRNFAGKIIDSETVSDWRQGSTLVPAAFAAKATIAAREIVVSAKDFSRAQPDGGIKTGRKTGAVKWYNPLKGYGFVYLPDISQEAFLHASVVESAGYASLRDEAVLECKVGPGKKGLQIYEIYSVDGEQCPTA